VNGKGFIYHTEDGGAHWSEQISKPGTYFRAVGFIDAQHGFAGNIGTDYFPGVQDETPMYRTDDGGKSWQVVETGGKPVKGICSIDVLHNDFINAGVLEQRVIVHAGGRVGGPAALLRSLDGGKSWTTIDMTPYTSMILDVKFFDSMTGFVFGASDTDVDHAHARIIMTRDGGQTWKTVYESSHLGELVWKGNFPTRDTGYATLQSYDPDTSHSQRYVVKTVDGGNSWQEIPLVNDAKVLEFGVGFIDANIGWVGALNGGYQTTDGGKNWTFVNMGNKVNKIRVLPSGDGFVAYAIGSDVYKLDARTTK
jgi:photosystem II stability/assembly factor-like uncharacterized protein